MTKPTIALADRTEEGTPLFTDLPEDQLRTYTGSVTEPPDFDEFWSMTLAESRQHPIDVRLVGADAGLATLDVYDLTFAGFAGQPVRGWLTVPSGTTSADPLPAVVEYIGYNGGRGLPTERLLWASAGYAHLLMDTRGQGSGWTVGDTEDPVGSGPAIGGVMTRGIESPSSYYYRRLTTDAVRAVDAARAIDLIDADRVAVLGVSQGGGLAIAVAGLVDGLAGVFTRVPFLCDFPRAVVITDSDPYKEIGRYLAVHRPRTSQVLDTLSYFDGVVHARRATAPAWFSTALMDATCPPSTVFAAFNAYAGPKDLTVYPFNGHEGGGQHEDVATLPRLRELMRPEVR